MSIQAVSSVISMSPADGAGLDEGESDMNGTKLRMMALLALGAVALAPTANAGVTSESSGTVTATSRYHGPPAAIAPAAFELVTRPQGQPVITPCRDSAVVRLEATLSGTSTSSDPRLTGNVVLTGAGLVSFATGVGSLDGTIRITDPATGKTQLVGTITQVITNGGTTFTGLVKGVLVPSGERVVATYSGADTADGTLTAVGQNSPVPPTNAGVVLSGKC